MRVATKHGYVVRANIPKDGSFVTKTVSLRPYASKDTAEQFAKLSSMSNSYIKYRMQIQNKATKGFGYSGDCK